MTPSPGPLRVLVVEDNDVNRKVVVRMLERLGCQVEIAVDGAEGVERASTSTYSVIFMDCSMPRMDGYEASRRIRELPAPHGQIPILALTAHATPADRARCLAAGMDLWIPKPISPDDLASAIERYAGWKGVAVAEDTILEPVTVAQLLDLEDPDDPSFLDDLVQEFRNTADNVVEDAQRLHLAGRLVEVQTAIQRLRNSATSVGAIRVVEACMRVEEADATTLSDRGREWLAAIGRNALKAVVALSAAIEARRASSGG